MEFVSVYKTYKFDVPPANMEESKSHIFENVSLAELLTYYFSDDKIICEAWIYGKNSK
jgi:hypothetical protein